MKSEVKIQKKEHDLRHIKFIAFIFSLTVFAVSASDWTQWFGSNHDGSSDETLKAWPASGPKQLWKIPMGEGLGTIAVAGGKAYVMAETQGGGGSGRGGAESVICLDANTGKQLWAAPVGPTILGEHSGNDGPRSTPAVDGGLVYAVGTYLNVACFDAKTGAQVWAHDLAAEFNGAGQLKSQGIGAWGCANSPVVDGDLVFVQGGGAGESFLAFDKKSGKLAWKAEDDLIAHTTPTVATIAGTRQVIYFSKKGPAGKSLASLVSFETTTGKLLWRFSPFAWKTSSAISPVVSGDIVYCSGGYNMGAAAAKITKEGADFKAEKLWEDPKMFSHWSTPVAHNGYFYGLIGFKEFGVEPLKCVEMATGKIMWSQNGFGQGGTALVDGKVLILGDKGQLVLCEANPAGYKELAHYQAFQLASPKIRCWNQPTVSNGKIYARTSTEALCLDASGK